MANLKDIRGRIASVKNIRKITRAMEMVAAARLRRAEQRIEALRPYADALRRMTRRASEAAANIPNMPILQEREDPKIVGILLVTGDRGLAGPFNSQIMRAGNRRAADAARRGQGGALVRLRAPRRVVAAVPRARDGRHLDRLHRPPRLRRRPHDRRRPGRRLRGRQGGPRGDHLQRLRLGGHPGGAPRDAATAPAGRHPGRRRRGRRTRTSGAATATAGTCARSGTTSPTPRRSWPGSCPTTSRYPSSGRCWSPRRPSTAPA